MEATQLHHSGVDVLSKLMSANFVGEVRNASSGEPSQQLTHGQRRPLGRRQLANQSATDPTRIEIKLIKKERIRVDDLHVVRLDRCGGKVLHVEGHHDLGPARDRCCQNVAIFRMTGHGVDQCVVVTTSDAGTPAAAAQ
jgi:hypothetical protein